MKVIHRYLLFFSYLLSSLSLISLILLLNPYWTRILTDWSFWPAFFFYLVSIEETYHWTKNSKRSEMSDLIAIAFFFFIIFFFTKDLFTSIRRDIESIEQRIHSLLKKEFNLHQD